MSSPHESAESGAELTGFDTRNCVTFDALQDSEYPLELLTENLLRMLNYEQITGVSEVISLAVLASGCEARYSLPELPDLVASSVATSIEAECMNHHHPASYPALQKRFSQRLVTLLHDTMAAMFATGDHSVLTVCSNCITALMASRLQSLRLTATTFAAAFVNAFDSAECGHKELLEALESRCSDVAVPIRKLALSNLPKSPAQQQQLQLALNDENASVRLLALRNLGNDETDPQIADRIYEMAGRDIDLSVRRASLRFLVKHNIVADDETDVDHDDMMRILYDEDEQSLRLAAELLVIKMVSEEGEDPDENEGMRHVLTKLAKIVVDLDNAEPISAGLLRARTALGNGWAEQCAQLVAQTGTKRADTQSALLNMLKYLVRLDNSSSSAVLPLIPQMLRKSMHSDDLLTLVLFVAAELDLRELAARSSILEGQVSNLQESVCDIFTTRESRSVIEAVSGVFAKLPAAAQHKLFPNVYHDLRLRLAELLGPRGNPKRLQREPLHATIVRLIQLARFVDVTDLVKLPIWPLVADGDEYMLNLARSIAMKTTDVNTIKLVVEKLTALKPAPAVDDILRIFISAKMRDIDIGIPFPIDINIHGPTSESVWRSAVASGVV